MRLHATTGIFVSRVPLTTISPKKEPQLSTTFPTKTYKMSFFCKYWGHMFTTESLITTVFIYSVQFTLQARMQPAKSVIIHWPFVLIHREAWTRLNSGPETMHCGMGWDRLWGLVYCVVDHLSVQSVVRDPKRPLTSCLHNGQLDCTCLPCLTKPNQPALVLLHR